MPYGYKKYRLENGISERTLHAEIQLIEHFIAYVNSIYKKHVDPSSYKSQDVKNFLAERRNNGLKDNTIRKDLSLLKQFFDYLWKFDKIPYDFTPKIKLELQIDKTPIEIDYAYLQSIYNNILTNSKIQPKAKVLFMLYMKGWKFRDIREIQLSNIQDNIDEIILTFPKPYGKTQQLVFTGVEIGPIIYCLTESIYRSVPYLLSSKIKGEYEQFSIYSTKTYLNSIIDNYNLPFTLNNDMLRYSYVHFLLKVKNMHIEDIANELGITTKNAAILVKEALERVKDNEYNKQRKIV